MNWPSVSVVIPTKDAGPGFEDILWRIDGQDYPAPVEVVVVDSGSTDGTRERARKFGAALRRIEPDDFHHARTRNYGAECASNEVVVFTVQDARPIDDTWLRPLVDALEEEGVGITYGRQVAYPDAKPMDRFFYQYFYPAEPRTITPEETADHRELYLENVFISDVTAAVPRDVWASVRFDPGTPMSEDKELAIRLLDAGYSLRYEPTAAVHHSHAYTLESLFRRRYDDGAAYADIAEQGEPVYLSNGLSYVAAEVRHLLSNGEWEWLPYAMVYDAVHFLAFQLGRRDDSLPRPLKRALGVI
ncbi:MAG: glycosyltransferase family 2 protein [Haloarculaceae archaeon]